jgi:hypothetical protein
MEGGEAELAYARGDCWEKRKAALKEFCNSKATPKSSDLKLVARTSGAAPCPAHPPAVQWGMSDPIPGNDPNVAYGVIPTQGWPARLDRDMQGHPGSVLRQQDQCGALRQRIPSTALT